MELSYKPLQYAGCYSLDLYCDQIDCTRIGPGQFTGWNHRQCAKDAKNAGWLIFTKTSTARCPKCVGKLKYRKAAHLLYKETMDTP